MKPTVGRRAWVKLWVTDWLEGTTRFQMSDAQRAFWIDLLAMAGRSRYGGVVCSGKDGDKWIGYPLAKYEGLMSEKIDVLATFELFFKTGKITLETVGKTPTLYTIFISSWSRYQSEYQRTKKYRIQGATKKLRLKSQPSYGKGSFVEEEKEEKEDGETDIEPEKKQKQNRLANPASSSDLIAAFQSFNCEPFGPPPFQKQWLTATRLRVKNLSLSEVMERCAVACQKSRIKVPRKFYELKRKFEHGEIASSRYAPLRDLNTGAGPELPQTFCSKCGKTKSWHNLQTRKPEPSYDGHVFEEDPRDS
jgi:hypothetical protein